MGKNPYQNVRVQVKRNLRPVVSGLLGMEPAIRATTPASVTDTRAGLEDHLAERGFHVVHETDVKEIHNHYRLRYPEFQILKVVKARRFEECPMATTAVDLDPGTSTVLPPGIAIYDLAGTTHVSAVRPSTFLAVFRDPDVRETLIELEGVLWEALEDGVPASELPEQELRITPDQGQRRARLKTLLNPVLSLVDAEYSIHVSSSRSVTEVVEPLRDALGRRGQHVVGDLAEGSLMLVVNPGQAHKALAIDPDVAVFAPLSVSVFEEDGRTHVRCVRPTTLFIFYGDPDLRDILMEMEMLLWNGLVAGVPEARVESRQPPLQPEGGQRTTAGGLPGALGSARGRPGD